MGCLTALVFGRGGGGGFPTGGGGGIGSRAIFCAWLMAARISRCKSVGMFQLPQQL